MKIKKVRKSHCPKCNKHTEHKVTTNKTTGKRGTLKKGSVARANKRGEGVGFGNLGKYSKGAITSWKRYGVKTSKKEALKITCKECNKSQLRKMPRAKKVVME